MLEIPLSIFVRKTAFSLYKLLFRPLLFRFSAEQAHYFTFQVLKSILKIPGCHFFLKKNYLIRNPKLKRNVFGIDFPNPVGLAAGLDKDANMVDEFAALGFGFIEIGTLTPRPQPGNKKPRLFRLIPDEAIINRMGFNNDGVHAAVEKLKKVRSSVIIGGNIGKNKMTTNEEAVTDYLNCFEALFPYVHYFVVNVSSPNTPGLRELQEKEPLKKLLNTLQKKNREFSHRKPILLKIAPDLNKTQLDDIIEIVKKTGIAGIIATNTTISREGLHSNPRTIEKAGTGGLSGQPLKNRSTEVIRYLHTQGRGAFPIIGVGGIHSAEDALEKLKAGASLIQVYTGFIYEGPTLVKKINKAILQNFG